MLLGAVALAVLLALVFARLPIGFAMALVGMGGMFALNGLNAAMALMAQVFSDVGVSSNLALLPLFVLMGALVTRSGMSHELYAAANSFLGHRRGGLAMATVVACGGFSAICGSSLATAATMTKVALPSMRRYRYDDRLAAGSIAAGGTLGILIPPSIILVIYGTLTETSIGKLFIAGIVPGILGVLLYMAAIWAVARARPELGPPAERAGWRQRLVSLRGVWGVAALFLAIMGGIYFGVFTPTEAAGIGAALSFLLALARRALTWRSFCEVLIEAVEITSVMFIVLIGALIFANFMNEAGLPRALAGLTEAAGIRPYAVILTMIAVYLLLGCVFESLSMILLTVPIFYPVVQALGFDLVWFGILVVVVTEIGLITPPVGLNLFVIKSVMPDVRTGDAIMGVLPFVGADLIRVALIVAFPALALFLPSLM